MRPCTRCQYRRVRPTFSYYCRDCYQRLQKTHNLCSEDLLIYFVNSYNFPPFHEGYYKLYFDHLYYYIRKWELTDLPLAELLEKILFLKVMALQFRN